MSRQIRVEVGRAWLPAETVARLEPGSEIPLKAHGQAEICADGRRIARGRLAIMDGCFCVEVQDVSDASCPGQYVPTPAGEEGHGS